MTIQSFPDIHLQRLCDVLGEVATGREIGALFQSLGIDDPQPGITKRHRLFAALSVRQTHDRCANLVVAFIHAAMDPVRFTHDPNAFESRRSELNHVLAFSGYSLGEDGKLQRQAAARTLTEAEERAGRLKAELRRRNVHPDVLAFCRSELLDKNYFHAVFEATKSVADKIRQRTGLQGDGPDIVDQAFALGKTGIPMLAFNRLQTETERSEQSGLVNLMKGMFGAFRNVTGHAPKISWVITEQDALDLLTIASLLHRRIDTAVSTRHGS